MENCLETPRRMTKFECKSEPKYMRTPLSVLQNTKSAFNRTYTPLNKQETAEDEGVFSLDELENPQMSERVGKIPLPILVQPSSNKENKDISKILKSLRSKTLKSILKNPLQNAQKNVHFCTDLKESNSHVELKSHSIATTSNSVSESRFEAPAEDKHGFKYEETIKAALTVPEFDEFPAVAFCSICRREIVTVVTLEKVRIRKGFMSDVRWTLCWCLPACFYNERELIHRCSLCGREIARIMDN